LLMHYCDDTTTKAVDGIPYPTRTVSERGGGGLDAGEIRCEMQDDVVRQIRDSGTEFICVLMVGAEIMMINKAIGCAVDLLDSRRASAIPCWDTRSGGRKRAQTRQRLEEQ